LRFWLATSASPAHLIDGTNPANFRNCRTTRSSRLATTESPTMTTPTLETVLFNIIQSILSEEPSCVTTGDPTTDATTGLCARTFYVEDAPREWFYDPTALIDMLDESIDALAHSDEPVWVAYANHPNSPAHSPFQSARGLLDFAEPGLEYVNLVAIGNPEQGWALVAEAALGDYSDQDADGSGQLSLHLGSEDAISELLAQRSCAAVSGTWSLLCELLDALPDGHRDNAKQSIRDRALALA